MSNDKAIATRNDDATTTRVVESVIIRGDISALTSEERARYYVQLCESMGLNPASQPLAPLRLNGKEILYPTRGATDQLAKIHKVNREIIDGPRVMKLGETNLVYAVCRATMPDGRTETATATVPFTDPINVLMKCETKAKRRATLSILGLGMLDETEIETIPASAKSEATPIDLHAAREQSAFVQRIHAIAESAYGNASLTAEQAAGVYWDAVAESADKPITSDDAADGIAACMTMLERGIPKAAFNRAWEAEKAKRAKAMEPSSVEPYDPAPPPPYDLFRLAVDTAEQLGADAIARAWIDTRPLRNSMSKLLREKSWRYALQAYGTHVKADDPADLEKLLRAAIARHEPTDGPRGGGTPRPTAPENTNATGDAVDTTTTASAVARWKGHLLGSHAGSVHAMANSLAKHRYDHGIPLDEMVAATVDVMTAQLVPVDGRSVRLSRADAERMCREALERAEKRAA